MTIRTLRPRLLVRMQIAVLLKAGTSPSTIAWALGCSLELVITWQQRIHLGQGLEPLPRPGPDPIYGQGGQAKVIALFCQKSPLPGCARWSLSDARTYMAANPNFFDGPIPSRATIARILQAHAIHPHKHQYFLQIVDPNFFAKMQHIIDLYLNPPQHLFLFDQLTGLQALDRITPDTPVQPHAPARQDFEYVRHGTLSICPVMDYHTGRIFYRTIADTQSVNITAVIAQHIQQFDPGQQLHYICDNHSSHSTQYLCDQIAELAGVSLPKDVKSQIDRRRWLQSTDKRIVFHFLPTHGSWLNLIEIWFGIARRKVVRGASFSSVDSLNQTLEAFSETWNEFLAHPFQWTYTGKGLHALVVKRNIIWLELESSQLTPKFLLAQLILWQHVFRDYREQVSPTLWVKLFQTITAKSTFIEAVLGEDEEARQRFNDFKAILRKSIILYFYLLCTNKIARWRYHNTSSFIAMLHGILQLAWKQTVIDKPGLFSGLSHEMNKKYY